MNSEKIRAVIIEDEDQASEYLSTLLTSNFPEIQILGYAPSVSDGIKLINSTVPELVFLDIELEDGLSFEILDQINRQDFEVIFITGFNQYYEKAMQHFAFNYLLKPIVPETFSKIIERYKEVKQRHFSKSKYQHFQNFIKSRNSKILLNTGNEHISVSMDEIVLCTAEGNYTKFELQNGKSLLVSHILKHYNDLLHYRGFFRASRSCLINTSHITSIYKKETIVMSNGEKVHVSTRNRGNLNELIDSLS